MMRTSGLFSVLSGFVMSGATAVLSTFASPVLAPHFSIDPQDLLAPKLQPTLQEGDTSPSTPASIFGWQNIPPLQPPPTPAPEESLPTLDAYPLPPAFDVT